MRVTSRIEGIAAGMRAIHAERIRARVIGTALAELVARGRPAAAEPAPQRDAVSEPQAPGS